MYKKSISIIKTKKKIRNKKTQNKKKVYNKKTKYLLKGSGNNSIQIRLNLNIQNTRKNYGINEIIFNVVMLDKKYDEKLIDENQIDENQIDETKTLLYHNILNDTTKPKYKIKTIYINAVDVSQPPPNSLDAFQKIYHNKTLTNKEKNNKIYEIQKEYYQNKTTESYKNIFNEVYNYIQSNKDKNIQSNKDKNIQYTLNLKIVFLNSNSSNLADDREKIIIKAIYESFLISNLRLIDPNIYSVNLEEVNTDTFNDLIDAQEQYLTQTSIEQITSVNVTPKLTGTPKSICELLVLYKNKI